MGGNIPIYDTRFNKNFVTERARSPWNPNMVPQGGIDLSPLRAVSENLSLRFKENKQREDSIWALTKSAELREKQYTYFLEKKNSYTPGSGGFVDDQLEQYSKYTSELEESAPSVEAKYLLRTAAARIRPSITEQSIAYEISSKMQKQVDDFNAAFEKNKIAIYHNPTTTFQVMHETLNSGLYKSLPKDKQQVIARRVKEGYAIANLTGRMDKLDEIENLNVKLNGYEALSKELNSGKWDGYLTFDKLTGETSNVNNMKQQIRDKIEARRLAALAVEAAEMSSLMEDDIASIEETGQGVIDPGRVKYLATQLGRPQMYSRYVKERGEAIKINTVVSKFDSGSINDAFQMLESYRPSPGQVGYVSKARTYNKLSTILSNRVATLNSDPAMLTTRSQSVINASKISPQKAIITSLAQQQKFGLSLDSARVLTNAQASQMAATLNAVGPEQSRALLTKWEQQYDFPIAAGGRTAWSKVQNELIKNGLNPNYAVINSLKNYPVSNDLITAQKVGYKSLQHNLPTGIKTNDIKAAVSNNINDFGRAVRLSTGRADSLSPVSDSAEMLAMHYLSTGRATSVDRAAKMATDQIVNNHYNVYDSRKNRNYSYYVPKTVGTSVIDQNKVNDNLKHLQSKTKIDNFLKDSYNSTRNAYSIYSGTPGLSREYTKKQVVDSASGRGVWVNNTQGTGVYLGIEFDNYGVLPLLDKNGNKYEFTFEELSGGDYR
jgi:hypothetical protein